MGCEKDSDYVKMLMAGLSEVCAYQLLNEKLDLKWE